MEEMQGPKICLCLDSTFVASGRFRTSGENGERGYCPRLGRHRHGRTVGDDRHTAVDACAP